MVLLEDMVDMKPHLGAGLSAPVYFWVALRSTLLSQVRPVLFFFEKRLIDRFVQNCLSMWWMLCSKDLESMKSSSGSPCLLSYQTPQSS